MRRRGPLLPLLLIGIVASAILLVILLSLHWFPTQGSKEASKIDTLYDVLLIASAPMFVLVATVVGYSVWKFRARPGQELADGPPNHGNTRLEVIWTAVPAALIIGLVAYAYVVLHDIEKSAPANERLTVQVTGQQFAWSYRYKRPQDGKDIQSNQLYVPINTQINFQVHARDVLHDFWVPAFRLKVDAVPGITTKTEETPNKLGDFPVVCAELCGLGHAVMRSTVHVVSRDDFNTWLGKQKPAGPGGTNQ